VGDEQMVHVGGAQVGHDQVVSGEEGKLFGKQHFAWYPRLH
jgi:hypothetical protein